MKTILSWNICTFLFPPNPKSWSHEDWNTSTLGSADSRVLVFTPSRPACGSAERSWVLVVQFSLTQLFFFFFSLLWWLSHFKTDVSAQCLVRVSHACVPLTSDLLSVEPLRFPGILCGGKLFRKANIRSFIFHHFIILRFTRGKQERIQTITRAGRGSTWTTVGPHEFRLDNGSTHSQGEHFNSIGSQNGRQRFSNSRNTAFVCHSIFSVQWDKTKCILGKQNPFFSPTQIFFLSGFHCRATASQNILHSQVKNLQSN